MRPPFIWLSTEYFKCFLCYGRLLHWWHQHVNASLATQSAVKHTDFWYVYRMWRVEIIFTVRGLLVFLSFLVCVCKRTADVQIYLILYLKQYLLLMWKVTSTHPPPLRDFWSSFFHTKILKFGEIPGHPRLCWGLSIDYRWCMGQETAKPSAWTL